MTFTEIQTEIAEACGLTAASALARIGREINRVYKRVTTAINVDMSRREVATASVTDGTNTATFMNIEKLETVYHYEGTTLTRPIVLREVSFDELRNDQLRSGYPRRYAKKSWTADSWTIELDGVAPATFNLYADVAGDASTLSAAQEPAFPESFHDVLVEGVLAKEYKRKGELAEAEDSRLNYEKILSDLKYWAAQSRWRTIRQGDKSHRWINRQR